MKFTVKAIAHEKKWGGQGIKVDGDRWFNVQLPAETTLKDFSYIKVGKQIEVDDSVVNEKKIDISMIKGVDYTSPNTTPLETPNKVEVPQSVWDEKDLRIVKQNALSHATEIVKYMHTPDKFDSEMDMANMVTLVAQILVDWVYIK